MENKNLVKNQRRKKPGQQEHQKKQGSIVQVWVKFKAFIAVDVVIEYKASLYFFCILFFYCVYLACGGVYQAELLIMGEIVLMAYFMGYFQTLGLDNFDEAERLSLREALKIFLCTAIYAGASWGFGWFDRKPEITLLFSAYMMFVYWCVYVINKIKREMDTRNLNKMLTEFKKGEGNNAGK